MIDLHQSAMQIRRGMPLLILLCLTACGGGDSTDGQNAELRERISEHGLSGDPATPRGLKPIRPSEDPMVKLGQMLFFSQSLAGSFDSSCGTCHLPHMGGSDGLSISVGVVPENRSIAGPGRKADSSRDRDPRKDDGPNMHRNSISTFNAALIDRALMFDGRVRVAEHQTEIIPGGIGQVVLTPESGSGGDTSGANGLLESVTKFPIANDNEMRGFFYSDISNPDSFRDHLVERLKGNVDQRYMREDAAENWLALFRSAYQQDDATADEVITLVNVQRALASYIKSQVFIDTPWKNYVEGNHDAISDEARQGALLFLNTIENGGLGCASCHSGDRLTNENFFNVGFPQIGRGFQRSDGTDAGRWMVTRDNKDLYAHRVPSLLNVDLTAPYGHAGTFESLESLLRYHANPRAAYETFDFGLQQLPQFSGTGISYPNAAAFTKKAIEHSSFELAEALLPNRWLSAEEETAVIAFLRSLSDRCAADATCIASWAPHPDEDPDGHMLGANNGPAPDLSTDPDIQNPDDYVDEVDTDIPPSSDLETFQDVVNCSDGLLTSTNLGLPTFLRKDQQRGLTAGHGFGLESWAFEGLFTYEFVMLAGGLTATYLNDDCWPDILFAGGDRSGMVAYLNEGGQQGFLQEDNILSGTSPASEYKRFTGAAVADLTGNYRRELLYGNLLQGDVVIKSADDTGTYREMARLPMTRNTYGISFGDIDGDGYLDAFMAHWDFSGVSGTAPALWRNQEGQTLVPYDIEAGTSAAHLDQQWNLTPKFADLTGNGHLDLLVASDFGTSAVLQSNSQGGFTVSTDTSVITDENGMGAALGDIDNNGRLDWFVTSVRDPNGVAEANWGVTGNRLYMNNSSISAIHFTEQTEAAGVSDGNWGWGACMADFNNDGFLDIFHTTGFGMIPKELHDGDRVSWVIELYALATAEFIGTTPRLFINNGDGTFEDSTAEWGIDVPSEGRGVICFDYDRDGDADIGLVDNSTGIQFFENQTGHAPGKRFLNIRLVGDRPNTDAIGSKVYLSADVGGGHGFQRQMRISEANSNYNSQNLPDLHFGVGTAEEARYLRIEWPDQSGLLCENVQTNQFIVFDQRDQNWPKEEPEAPNCSWHENIGVVDTDIPVTP